MNTRDVPIITKSKNGNANSKVVSVFNYGTTREVDVKEAVKVAEVVSEYETLCHSRYDRNTPMHTYWERPSRKSLIH